MTALRITTVINLVCIVATITLMSRCLTFNLLESAILILFSGIGLANCLRLGQLYIILSLSIVLGYYAYTKKRPVLAGICF